jgi:5-carboxymethyl-2-hydroxymuconate isomerase
MPHLRIEYSQNLQDRLDAPAFCAAMHKAMLATGLFEVGAIRVRAYCADAYAVGDLLPQNGFVDMTCLVAEGRGAEALKTAGDDIFAVAKAYLAPFSAAPHFAFGFRIEVIDGALNWKHNSMHARLR